MLMIFICAILVLTFVNSITSEAASVKKMAVYDKMIKMGDIVFCCIRQDTYDEDGQEVTEAIVSVNCNTGEVKTLTTLGTPPNAMAIKGNYLYCLTIWEDTGGDVLNRINISTGKVERLADSVEEYAISGNTIYYRIRQYKKDKKSEYRFIGYKNKKMKLNGKSKKNSSVRPKFVKKSITSDNYRLIEQERGKYYYFYLQTPGGKSYYLGKCIDEFA